MVLDDENESLDSRVDGQQAGLDHIVALHIAEPANDRPHRHVPGHPNEQPFLDPAAGRSAATRSHGQAERERNPKYDQHGEDDWEMCRSRSLSHQLGHDRLGGAVDTHDGLGEESQDYDQRQDNKESSAHGWR